MRMRILLIAILVCAFANVTSAGFITLNESGQDRIFSDSADGLIVESRTGTLDDSVTGSHPSISKAGTVQAFAEITDVMRLSLQSNAEFGSVPFNVALYAATREQYFLSGPDGATADLTVRFAYDGLTQQSGDSRVSNLATVRATLGTDHKDAGIAEVLGEIGRDTDGTEFVRRDNDHVHSGEITHTFSAMSGDTFEFAYGMLISHSTGDAFSQFTDMTNTAIASFDVPAGFTLTSQGGFGAPTAAGPGASAVPEPSSLALLSMGTLSMLGFGWRRKRLGG